MGFAGRKRRGGRHRELGIGRTSRAGAFRRDDYLAARIASPARRLAVVLIAVVLLSWLGLTTALDKQLQRLYYRVRGARTTNTGVLMVGIDQDTLRTWGTPPWGADRWDPLFQALLEGKPKLVAVLEPRGRLFSGAPSTSALVSRARVDKQLILPPASDDLGQPAVVFDGGAVDALSLRMPVGVPTAIHEVLEKLGVDTRRAKLPVNYLGANAPLPTLPAHRVAAREIPLSTFKDRVVVIGLVGEGVAPLVPTPVGPMTESEVHVHALLALTDGDAWNAIPAWLLWMLVISLALLAIVVLPRLSGTRTIWVVGGLLAASLVADYILFSRGVALMGAALPGAAVLLAAMVSWAGEQAHAHTELATLVQLTKDHLTSGREDLPRLDGSDRSIERFVESTRLLLDFEGSVFAELPRGKWHLRLRVFNRLTPGDIIEMRRDVRRDPFKTAYVSHRPEWSSRAFVSEEVAAASLLVPLVEFGRVLGVWILTFDSREQVGSQELEIVEALADELTRALSRARLTSTDADGGRKDHNSGALADEVTNAYDAVFAFAASQTHLNQTLNLLPVGVLVAAFSGTLQFVNVAMRQFLGAAGIHSPGSITLIELLSALLSQPEEEVCRTLRGLLGEVGFVRMSVMLSSPASPPARYELVITRVSAELGISGARSGNARGPSQFVITATARNENVLARATWDTDQAEARPAMRVLPAFSLVDLSAMLRTLVAEVASTSSVTLDLPDALPLIHTTGSGLSDGLAALLTLHPRSHIRVEEQTETLEIDVEIPEMTLTAADVAAINSSQTHSLSRASPARQIAEASSLLQQAQAEVLVASSLQDGTTIGVLVRTSPD